MQKAFLLGNEAIAHGALAADVRVVTSYPGTPASEIGDFFSKLPLSGDFYFECSTNEKVAVEVAAGVALSGLRSLAVMKHVGVNVASDPMMSIPYCGVTGGMVLVSADDPSCHSSQNEQDNRTYARFFNIPMLEPSTVQEAADMTQRAFDISHEVQLPVMLRTTTRLNHARAVVSIGPRQKLEQRAEFLKDPRYVERMAAHSRLLERAQNARALSEASALNFERRFGPDEKPRLGFITSGVSYGYVCDVIANASLSAGVLKLGFSHPLPETKIGAFLDGLQTIIVVEELEPFIEDCVARLAKDRNPGLIIVGKRSGHFRFDREYDADTVARAIAPVCPSAQVPEPKRPAFDLPFRYSTLCPGCSHRNTYYAVKRVFGDAAIYPSDIGCYSLGILPPVKLGDIWLCMGSGAGLGGGFSRANPDTPVVAFIGDGTFLHSGIPAVLNAVQNQHDFILVIFDNRITAMTGHQPNAGSEAIDQPRGAKPVDIENLLRALGVEELETVQPQQIKATIAALRRLQSKRGFRVLLARQPCIVNVLKREEGLPKTRKFRVRQEACNHCATCIDEYGCPAFFLDEERDVQVNEMLCLGCGDCVQVCPTSAIVEARTGEHRDESSAEPRGRGDRRTGESISGQDPM